MRYHGLGLVLVLHCAVGLVAARAGAQWVDTPADRRAEAARHDAAGVRAGDAGKLADALAEFREAIRLAPELADAHLHLGLALERTGKARDALAAYDEALRLRPGLVEARYGLASICAQLGDLDGAIALLQHVVGALPQFAEAHFNLGVNLWNRYKNASGFKHNDDLGAAVKELEAATRLEPREPRFHFAFGQLLAERQELTTAVEQLRIAAAQAERDPEYTYNLGLVLRLKGELDAAEAQFRAALQQNPQHTLARRARGLVLRQKGEFEAAAAELGLATAALPDDAQGHHLLGTVLLRLDRTSAAVEEFREAIRLAPDLIEARVSLAQVLARAGGLDEARAQQAEIKRLNEENASVGRTLILLQTASERLASGDIVTAIAQLREATDISPTFPEALYQLGVALERASSDAPEIERTFRQVLQRNGDHALARYHIGRLLARSGHKDGAQRELERATELAPGLVDAYRELARLALDARDWSAAARHLQRVLMWEPGDQQARDDLERALASVR